MFTAALKISFLFCILMPQILFADIGRGLVDWYKMDDASGSTVTDFGSNATNGTINGTTTWVTGKINGALNFDGSTGYVKPGNLLNFSSTGTFSVAAWINLPSTASSHNIFCDSWIASGANPGWIVYISSSAKLTFFGASSSGHNGTFAATASVVTGIWNHVVMTYNNKIVTLYINGIQDSQSSSLSGIQTATMSTSTYGSLIGANFNTTNATFTNLNNGSLDDVRVYSRVLSQDEVTQIYNTGKLGNKINNGLFKNLTMK